MMKLVYDVQHADRNVPGAESSVPIAVPVAELRVVSLLERTRIFRYDKHTGCGPVDLIAEGLRFTDFKLETFRPLKNKRVTSWTPTRKISRLRP
jgi:hypothetical protein